jgi:hypothetical protein
VEPRIIINFLAMYILNIHMNRLRLSGFRDANRRMYLIVDARGVSLIMYC